MVPVHHAEFRLIADAEHLVSFAQDEDLTIRMRSAAAIRLFGDFAISYAVAVDGPEHSRLVAKLLLGNAPGLFAEARCRALAWGDLLMMRRQLLTFRDLAERDAARPR